MGKYQAAADTLACIGCSAGRYNDQTSSNSAAACQVHASWDAGKNANVTSPAGIDCAAGKYSASTDATAESVCMAAPRASSTRRAALRRRCRVHGVQGRALRRVRPQLRPWLLRAEAVAVREVGCVWLRAGER